jgi:hypothetical protein
MSISKKLTLGAGVLGIFGLLAVPVASYAATTTLEVAIASECLIGDGVTGNNNEGVSQLSVSLSTATPYDETTATIGNSLIGAVCNNDDGYTITETMSNANLTYSTTSGSGYDGATVGFSAGPGSATLANFAANTWSIKYADVTGTTVDTAAKSYDRTPNTTGIVIAETNGPTALSTFSQQFGAKTDGTVATGFYGAVATYTLATR